VKRGEEVTVLLWAYARRTNHGEDDATQTPKQPLSTGQSVIRKGRGTSVSSGARERVGLIESVGRGKGKTEPYEKKDFAPNCRDRSQSRRETLIGRRRVVLILREPALSKKSTNDIKQ